LIFIKALEEQEIPIGTARPSEAQMELWGEGGNYAPIKSLNLIHNIKLRVYFQPMTPDFI